MYTNKNFQNSFHKCYNLFKQHQKHHKSAAKVHSKGNPESVRVSKSTTVRTNVITNVKSSKSQPEKEDIPLSQIIQKKRSASNSKRN